MPFTTTNLQEDINIAINKAKGGGLTKAQITSVISAISTAQTADLTVHDTTIETPPAAMLPDMGDAGGN